MSGRADPRFADYHIASNADIFDIDVIFVDERDEKASPLRIKGVGEIGTAGATRPPRRRTR